MVYIKFHNEIQCAVQLTWNSARTFYQSLADFTVKYDSLNPGVIHTRTGYARKGKIFNNLRDSGANLHDRLTKNIWGIRGLDRQNFILLCVLYVDVT
jgi:hypothetical protein